MHEIEGYRLEKRLGSGGFATVWLGFDERLDGHVAIKILADNWTGDEDVTRRFVEEARFMWRADDPRIVSVHTVGELANGQPYFVMEYADRGTLLGRIEGGLLDAESLSLDHRVGLIREIGACVGAVHDEGALHRDVKPENFLIRSGRRKSQDPIPGLADDERLLIADLGLAKTTVAASGVSIAAGSPGYMAPEQANLDGRIDQRADIFALGVMAFEVLSGQRAFKSGQFSLTALLETIDDIPLVSEANPAVPASFDPVLRKAMDPVVEDRYPDVATFMVDLDAALKAPATPANSATVVAPTPAAATPAVPTPAVPTPAVPSSPVAPVAPAPIAPAPAAPTPPSVEVSAPAAPVGSPAASPAPVPAASGGSGRLALIGGGLVAAILAVVAIVVLTRGGTEPEESAAPSATAATATLTAEVTDSVASGGADSDSPAAAPARADSPLLLGGEIRLPPPATIDAERSTGTVSVFTVDQSDLESVVRGIEEQLVVAGFAIDSSSCCSTADEVRVMASRDAQGSSSAVFASIGEGSRAANRFTFLWLEQ